MGYTRRRPAHGAPFATWRLHASHTLTAMITGPSAVLQALAKAAVDATAARQGWLLLLDGAVLRVVAAEGGEGDSLVGVTVPADAGSAGFVVASGQPMALAPSGDLPQFGQGVGEMLGRAPTSVLSVPCGTADEVVGVLELVDKAAGGSFSIDDVELATLLAGVAGAALAQPPVGGVTVPTPDELSGELSRLARTDAADYAAVAQVISALLARV